MKDSIKLKILEMIPGILVWGTLAFVLIFSFLKPLWAIYFILVFDLYWLLRIIYNLFYLTIAWRRYRKALKIDWFEKVKKLENWKEYYHLVILPTCHEPFEIVELPFKGLAKSSHPLDKFIVVLSGEEPDKNNFLKIAEKIKLKYGSLFFNLIINIHPANQLGELQGKGANANHAGHRAKLFIDELNIPYEKVIVSCFDIDTFPHEQYFSHLTYKFLTHRNPTRASYQPVAIYNNNVWESNPIIRVVASSTTFWLFTDLARPERLFTFSSHSMSFKALVDVGFWDKTIVTEDSRIFLQCLVRYDGDYEVVPLQIPVFMNTVEVGNFRHSLINQYKQIRRWAWGVEHFPWMVNHFWGQSNSKKIPFAKKIYYLWNQTEGVYSWATVPFIIFILGNLPLWVAGETVRQTAFFQNSPYVLNIIMRLAMISLIVIAILYGIMLPPKPNSKNASSYIIMLVQWLMIPVTLLLFGSIPAIDAQTRLMLGGKFRLGFWVTEKKSLTKNKSSYKLMPRYE